MEAEKTIEITRKIISGGILTILVGTVIIAASGQFKAKDLNKTDKPESIYNASNANLLNVSTEKEIKLEPVKVEQEYKLDPFIKLAQSHCIYYGGSPDLCNDLEEMTIRAEGLKTLWEEEYVYCLENVLGTICNDAGAYINNKINPPLKWRNDYQWRKVEKNKPNVKILGLF
jgi:hypothetical protein